MDIKFKKTHENAVVPKRANPTDAGADLTAVSLRVEMQETGDAYGFVEYDTGISVAIPDGYVGLIFPRSSVSKTALQLANSVGVIDSSYRGSIKVRFRLDALGHAIVNDCDGQFTGLTPATYKVGDRIAQLVVVPISLVNYVETDTLDETIRGEGGFGSSGT